MLMVSAPTRAGHNCRKNLALHPSRSNSGLKKSRPRKKA